MNNSLINEPLTEIRTYGWEKFFVKIKKEEFQKIYEANIDISHKLLVLSHHNGKTIKFSSIKDFNTANWPDYFREIILPKLPWQIKSRMTDKLNFAEANGQIPALSAILRVLTELEEEFKT